MKSKWSFLILMVLALSLVLSGCGIFQYRLVAYDEMQYTRPDMVSLSQVLEQSCASAREETDIKKLETAILNFYAVYDDFYTNMNLAFIHYCSDLTDIYWEEQYSYCSSQSATVNAGLDQLYRCLATSPLRQTLEGEDYFGEGYFDSYEGEGIYDEYMLQLLEKEAQLLSQYQAINAQAATVEYYSDAYFTQYGSQMAQVYLQLISLRQEMAAYVGYDSYVDFAYDFYHIRDYTPQQAVAYMADIRAELVPLYQKLNSSDFWQRELEGCTEEQMLEYVKSMAKAMGGTVNRACSQMVSAGVYDITYGENKYNTSYEVYLSTYYTPFIFLCPTGTEYDKLTFAHEFGHFCCDFSSYGGSVAGVDVGEIFSQAMEYLSLSYADDVGQLRELKMADCLSVYVEQAAYASFEHQVYSLTKEALTVENIQALYEDVFVSYGLDVPGWDSRDYVCVTHFYESPMYIISYVLSNDAALQIYELEQAEKGKGLACFTDHLQVSQPYFLVFLKEAGLESPFADGRLTQVRQTLEEILT